MSNTNFPIQREDELKHNLAHKVLPPWRRYDRFDIEYVRPSLQSSKGLNFFQTLKWSPGGRSILALTENQKLTNWPISTRDTDTKEQAFILGKDEKKAVTPSECVYSFAWHPFQNNEKQDSDLFAFSTKDYPIQLYNIAKQQRVSSFYIVDHREQFTGSHCMDFTPDGEYLIAGGTDNVYLFNVHQGQKSPVSTTPTSGHGFSTWEPTLDGVQSSICLNPQNPRTVALGTFNNTVGIYDNYGSRPCQLKFSLATGTGITCMKWSPDGCKMYVGSRKSTQIEVWDTRYAQDMLYELKDHKGDTNQRMSFDTFGYEGLISGGTDGCVSVWQGTELVEKINVTDQRNVTVAAVQKHPLDSSLLALCYGRRSDIMDDEDGFSSMEYWNSAFSSLQLWGMNNAFP
ncbi:heterotrimeric G protein beta (WD repeat) subunit Gnr1 [Schizosaccharomyces osmophilus]|uniref:Heterotrimeric G protein beta (WD repeat) subunit Gnr1 n=1 Tax=Schizosaccharomyces osmophilus TaxID=2545709 RepID=A0AAE9WC06_9SCHI|nr:heterotrimeric G protein beta (WD repeat) subunit Gnr1 [Schizosaccharomyces osmophilus]WBW73123.1 heterotrimeric G protein beta (WD repeat) subunit Gnr1 [Schizosaccharomyces osmophilus]